jgi:hypothetical protein
LTLCLFVPNQQLPDHLKVLHENYDQPLEIIPLSKFVKPCHQEQPSESFRLSKTITYNFIGLFIAYLTAL